ncbi:MAG: PHP domain-containing protein [Sphaerochaeta sp.]|nr:PHP domain-containing protein [Sphaerochaeta sp.]
MVIDSHVHSRFSYDGHDTISALLEGAIAEGVAVLTVTDHCDIRSHRNGHEPYFASLEERRRALLAARQALGDPLVVLDGIELGDIGNGPELALSHLNSYPYDFVLGSVHHALDGSPVDIYRDDPHMVVELYFMELERMVEWGHFDSLAHLDYPIFLWKAPGPTFRRFEAQINRVLKRLAEQGKALEVNASGLFRDVGRVGPEPWVLERFKEYGGRYITVGSDSHWAKDIGRGITEAYEVIRQAGFDQIVYYRSRVPVTVKI